MGLDQLGGEAVGSGERQLGLPLGCLATGVHVIATGRSGHSAIPVTWLLYREIYVLNYKYIWHSVNDLSFGVIFSPCYKEHCYPNGISRALKNVRPSLY